SCTTARMACAPQCCGSRRLWPAPAHEAQQAGFLAVVHSPGTGRQEIQLFGDGRQRRDFTYVDDAVDAFLLAGCTAGTDAEIYNLGGETASLLEVVELLISLAGRGSYRIVPFPAEKRVIDIGSYEADYGKI